MREDEVARAVAAARDAVGAPADAVAAWRLVDRLDPGRPPYLLVGLGLGESGRVVAVGGDGAVRQTASDPAGVDAWWASAAGDLVWAPGSGSRSPLYPLVRTRESGEVVLRDHAGERVRAEAGRPDAGGAGAGRPGAGPG